jgi:hypothetical protein
MDCAIAYRTGHTLTLLAPGLSGYGWRTIGRRRIMQAVTDQDLDYITEFVSDLGPRQGTDQRTDAIIVEQARIRQAWLTEDRGRTVRSGLGEISHPRSCSSATGTTP